MCGFFFIYHEGLSHDALARAADESLTTLAHRGPDDEGRWINPPVALGHRRLSIIDLGGSRQPMHDTGQRFVLVYNGEIYNYKELRMRLRDRWAFRTEGDTEVLLAGLVTYGADFCQQMEGMWAFALWDRETRTLIMGRDRMGKKPLFFQSTPYGLACASELPALACLTSPWEEDLDSTADYFRYGFYLPGTTAYRGVFELLPGHVATWTPRSQVRQRPYWSLSLQPFNGDRKQAREQLEHTLVRAVERRLVADVEVGAFLSGGVDSSLIVSLMSKVLGQRPKTFTIGFAEDSYDERAHARAVAHYCGTDHYEDCLDTWDPARLQQLVLEHVGQPLADSSLLPTALVAHLASRYVKVALSGDGGDELFSGYQRYQARVLLRWYTRLPRLVRNNLERVIRAVPEPMAHHSSSVLKKAHLFSEAARRQDSETPYTAPLFFSREEFARFAPALADRGHAPPGLPNCSRLDDIQAMMAMDALVYLPQDILTKIDRATMTYSLELRAPFLDTNVVELAFSVPRHWHRRGFRGKRLLREAFADKLPRKMWLRRKQGFAVPVHRWFRNNLADTLLEFVKHADDAPFLPSSLHRMLSEHRAGMRDHGYRLWAIYVYLLWKRHAKESAY